MFLETAGEIRLIVYADYVAYLIDPEFAVFKQFGSVLDSDEPDIIVWRHSCEFQKFSSQGGMTHQKCLCQ